MGMKGYKGFRKGLICKDKQYAENTIFEESEANICVNGMHFCKNPMDVLDHYPLIDDNGEMCEFAEVEALDETFTDDDKKYCTKKLKIGARLSLAEFIKASFDVTYQQIKEEVDNVSEKENVVDNATLAGGNGAKLAGGDNAKLAGGNGATLAGGKHSIMVSENGGRAKGGMGSVIVMVERNDEGEIVNYKAIQIDGDKYKEDTWYRLEDGEIKEVE
nr:MAG TPA: hypothetical protein [Caudoviricetes sp.]